MWMSRSPLTWFTACCLLNRSREFFFACDYVLSIIMVTYGTAFLWTWNLEKYILIIVQWDATQTSLFIILQVRCTCFRCQPHPSSGVHKTVTTASGTGHIFCAATSLQHDQAWSWREVAAQKIWPVPEAVVTVLCTHDGCGWHPKHVEWTCRIINRLLCVASHWTVINPLTPNNPYSGRIAPLTSKRCILYIYSTNTGT